MGKVRAIGYIKSTDKGTRIKRSGTFAWLDARQGDILYPGDSVSTHNRGKGAVVRMRNGIERKMRAGSSAIYEE